MYYSKVGSCPLALLQEHINMDEVISAIVIVGNPGGMRHARGGGGPAAGEPTAEPSADGPGGGARPRARDASCEVDETFFHRCSWASRT